jgi:hypothetical protein
MGKFLSDGKTPNTLGGWRSLSVAVFGEDSPATKFLDDKIAKTNADDPVIADETQLLHVLTQLHFNQEK